MQQGGLADDLLVTALVVTEIIGDVDPAPLSDLANAGLNAAEGNYGAAALSLAGALIPGGGDKAGKVGADVRPVQKLDPRQIEQRQAVSTQAAWEHCHPAAGWNGVVPSRFHAAIERRCGPRAQHLRGNNFAEQPIQAARRS